MKADKMNTASEIAAIADHVGLVDRSDRVRIEITGPDRGKFVHNLTTNEVKRLATGRGCEAFVTSPQGKTIGYLIIHVLDDRILARTDAGGAELLMPHLRKYGVFDDVAIEDTTGQAFEFHLAGSRAAELVERCGGGLPEEAEYAHASTALGDSPVRIVRESPAGLPGLTVIGLGPAARSIKEHMQLLGREIGLIAVDAETFEYLRIAAGTPVFGKDITEKNLPQELGRDARAISFVKGCYLGQETVARIDALGHVNQVLKGLRLSRGAPCPEAGSLLEHDGKRVGVITSATLAPGEDGPLALGLIRTTHSQPGTPLELKPPGGTRLAVAIVSDLPMLGSP
jgi:folate-binding protein YgfZ